MTIGAYRHVVTLAGLGAPVPDGDGGYTIGPAPLDPPTWHCSIDPATQRELEQVSAGTVITTASHIVRGRWRPDITTETQLTFRGRTLHVTSVRNLEERNITLELVCEEQTAP
jgi:head-tail adaptor